MSLGLSGRIPSDWLDVSSGGWVAWSFAVCYRPFRRRMSVPSSPCSSDGHLRWWRACGEAWNPGKGRHEAFEKAAGSTASFSVRRAPSPWEASPASQTPRSTPANHCVDEVSEATLTALKAVEESSSHPIAKAIISLCKSKTTESINIDIGGLEELPGKGMRATCTSEPPFELIVVNEVCHGAQGGQGCVSQSLSLQLAAFRSYASRSVTDSVPSMPESSVSSLSRLHF